nr:MAG TPA: hypothetical protein [Caudoviricetes sp.]
MVSLPPVFAPVLIFKMNSPFDNPITRSYFCI